MTDLKKWSGSLTIWGVVAMALPALARLAGFDLGAADAAILTDQAVAIWQAVAAIVAVYGRVRASKPIATKSRVNALAELAKPKAKGRNSKGQFVK